MTRYNRKDYSTALPQLEKLIKELADKTAELKKEIEELEKRVKELEDA